MLMARGLVEKDADPGWWLTPACYMVPKSTPPLPSVSPASPPSALSWGPKAS